MNHPFITLWNKPSRLMVGLMSGTSATGAKHRVIMGRINL